MTYAVKIIGLTGNIATGKSVIRRMLANSGALGIDADDIAHRMLYPNSPAYKPVIDTFGEQILSPQGEISRGKLAEIVFSDEEKLRTLENLIHPWVTIAIKKRIERSSSSLVVVEAIKLLESGLMSLCDTIWVSQASEDHQIRRLQQIRNMGHSQAKRRIAAQSPQSEKLNHAEVVINTEGAFKNTWESIQDALNDTIQTYIDVKSPHFKNNAHDWHCSSINSTNIESLDDCWQKFTPFSTPEMYEQLGAQMLLPLYQDDQCGGFLLWNNHNFTASLASIHPKTLGKMPFLVSVFEHNARKMQCEILFLPLKFVTQNDILIENLGFKKQTSDDLAYEAWQTALKQETRETNAEIWTKTMDQPVETIANLTE